MLLCDHKPGQGQSVRAKHSSICSRGCKLTLVCGRHLQALIGTHDARRLAFTSRPQGEGHQSINVRARQMTFGFQLAGRRNVATGSLKHHRAIHQTRTTSLPPMRRRRCPLRLPRSTTSKSHDGTFVVGGTPRRGGSSNDPKQRQALSPLNQTTVAWSCGKT